MTHPLPTLAPGRRSWSSRGVHPRGHSLDPRNFKTQVSGDSGQYLRSLPEFPRPIEIWSNENQGSMMRWDTTPEPCACRTWSCAPDFSVFKLDCAGSGPALASFHRHAHIHSYRHATPHTDSLDHGASPARLWRVLITLGNESWSFSASAARERAVWSPRWTSLSVPQHPLAPAPFSGYIFSNLS